MTLPLLHLDHIGIAVPNLDEAIKYYRETFGARSEGRETVSQQKVELIFVTLQNSRLELLAPTGEDSTIAKFLATRGPGLHHLCYRVENLSAELARLKGLGVRLIDEKPRPGAHGTQVAFLHPKSTAGVLTELCEYCSR